MSDTSTKAGLRRAAFAERKAAFAAYGEEAPAQVADLVTQSDLLAGAGVVSGYRPIRTEIDPTPIMTALHASGIRLCVPVIRAMGEPLDFAEWTPDSVMIEGAFGASIPRDGTLIVPDTLIAPLVAFDRQGGRLGYGGGFYDRTLAKLRAARGARAVGLAFAAQEVPAVPREPTDELLDAVVTEREIIRP